MKILKLAQIYYLLASSHRDEVEELESFILKLEKNKTDAFEESQNIDPFDQYGDPKGFFAVEQRNAYDHFVAMSDLVDQAKRELASLKEKKEKDSLLSRSLEEKDLSLEDFDF